MADYYIRHSIINQSEDQEHEFKGHMSIAEEEISPFHVATPITDRRRRMTRKPSSRTLSAFLNTGLGGTLYLGILDTGIIEGLPLTADRKQHLLQSLSDAVSRFRPHVTPNRIVVTFVPVFNEDELLLLDTRKAYRERVPLGRVKHFRSNHMLRTYKSCWCAYRSRNEYMSGILQQRYVIEIHVTKWDPENSNHGHVTVGCGVRRHAFHCNEGGKYYYRGHGSIRHLDKQQLAKISDLHDQIRLREAVELRHKQLSILKKRLEPKQNWPSTEDDEYVVPKLRFKTYS